MPKAVPKETCIMTAPAWLGLPQSFGHVLDSKQSEARDSPGQQGTRQGMSNCFRGERRIGKGDYFSQILARLPSLPRWHQHYGKWGEDLAASTPVVPRPDASHKDERVREGRGVPFAHRSKTVTNPSKKSQASWAGRQSRGCPGAFCCSGTNLWGRERKVRVTVYGENAQLASGANGVLPAPSWRRDPALLAAGRSQCPPGWSLQQAG